MSHFTDALPEVFDALGPITVKRMFGGAGVWHDGLMCAVVIRDTLYLKTDATTRPHFDALALPPFSYARGERVMETSYRQAPETVFEDRHEAALWVRRAFEAALRVANAKPVRARAARKPAAKKAPAKTLRKAAGQARKSSSR